MVHERLSVFVLAFLLSIQTKTVFCVNGTEYVRVLIKGKWINIIEEILIKVAVTVS